MTKNSFALALAALLFAGCTTTPPGYAGRQDAGPTGIGYAPAGCTSVDTDGDGISDQLEGNPGDDHDADGVPNIGDNDDDGDGILDSVERGTGTNACVAVDSDGDSLPDFADFDSDNDGVPDSDEALLHTDPTNRDTDGDGITDLGEIAAGVDPLDASSTIPEGDFFVVLPYQGAHSPQTLRFGTRIDVADVFFLIDETGSMGDAIDNVNSSLMRIASEVSMLIRDVQFGVGSFRDFPIAGYGDPNNEPFTLRQEITSDLSSVNGALSLSAQGGNDIPESSVEALFQTATGEGITYSGGSVAPANCGIPGPDDLPRIGYPCFRPGALPIIVHVTDAPFHSGVHRSYNYSGIPTAHDFDQAANALNDIGARYIGVDLREAGDDQRAMATATGSMSSTGSPLVYYGNPSTTSDQIITGITSLVGGTPQDVTTATHNVAGNPDNVDATTFIQSITPVEGYAADGTSGPAPGHTYASRDTTTFYEVIPGTEVDFAIDFWNNVRPPAATAQIFKASIVVLGNGVATLDTHTAYIVVPPDGDIILL